jgi:hypothetical protein
LNQTKWKHANQGFRTSPAPFEMVQSECRSRKTRFSEIIRYAIVVAALKRGRSGHCGIEIVQRLLASVDLKKFDGLQWKRVGARTEMELSSPAVVGWKVRPLHY